MLESISPSIHQRKWMNTFVDFGEWNWKQFDIFYTYTISLSWLLPLNRLIADFSQFLAIYVRKNWFLSHFPTRKRWFQVNIVVLDSLLSYNVSFSIMNFKWDAFTSIELYYSSSVLFRRLMIDRRPFESELRKMETEAKTSSVCVCVCERTHECIEHFSIKSAVRRDWQRI